MENINLNEMNTCPHCGETVRQDAKNCSYCGRDIDQRRLKGQKRPAYLVLGIIMLVAGLFSMQFKFGTVLILFGACFIIFALFSGNI
jgi:uncharacterized protein (DUF983 family)